MSDLRQGISCNKTYHVEMVLTLAVLLRHHQRQRPNFKINYKTFKHRVHFVRCSLLPAVV